MTWHILVIPCLITEGVCCFPSVDKHTVPCRCCIGLCGGRQPHQALGEHLGQGCVCSWHLYFTCPQSLFRTFGLCAGTVRGCKPKCTHSCCVCMCIMQMIPQAMSTLRPGKLFHISHLLDLCAGWQLAKLMLYRLSKSTVLWPLNVDVSLFGRW